MIESGYIHINNHIFPTLLAISAEEQSKGLMYQEWPPPVMSFIYDTPSINKFWMANTTCALDIVFSHNGAISQICRGEPYSTSTIGNDSYSDLIVEFPYGTVKSFGIKVGDDVGLVKPNLEELKKLISEKRYGIIKF